MKSYSPELMILPILSEEQQHDVIPIVEEMRKLDILKRTHVFVIGPGLGREMKTMHSVLDIIGEIKRQPSGSRQVVVLDGDGLHMLCSFGEEILSDNFSRNLILTPNHMEYQRLLSTFSPGKHERLEEEVVISGGDKGEVNEEKELKELCKSMGNLVIVKKGQVDLISNGMDLLKCSEKGSPRRCGGQGDILAGVLGTFIHWANISIKNSGSNYQQQQIGGDIDGIKNGDVIDTLPIPNERFLLAGFAACSCVRMAASLAFDRYQRGMTTPDILQELPLAMMQIVDQPPPQSSSSSSSTSQSFPKGEKTPF